MAGKREYCPHCGSKAKAGHAGWWCSNQDCQAARRPLWSWQLVERPKRKPVKSVEDADKARAKPTPKRKRARA